MKYYYRAYFKGLMNTIRYTKDIFMIEVPTGF